jgi:hypothetical protein
MTTKIEKIVNYSKYYDTSLWSLDCLYCKLHNPEKEIDTWYDCNECCSEFTEKPKEYILKQRYKMKLVRNILVPQPASQPVTEEDNTDTITEPEQEVEIDPIKPYFYIKGINQLNEFMKTGRKYLEKNIGIEFDGNFCSSVMKKEYDQQIIGMNDLIFRIDFSKSRPTTKNGMIFLNILLSGEYSLDQMIGFSITNKLNEINQIQ